MKRKVLAIVAILFLGIAFSSPYFRVDEIHFSKVNFISEKDLSESLAKFEAQNVFKLLILNRIESTVSTYKQLKSLSIDYSWPNQLRLSLEEKSPWMSCMSEGKTILLAQDGTILSKGGDYPVEAPDQLLVVKGMGDYYFQTDHISKSVLKKLQDIYRLMKQNFKQSSVLLEQDAHENWQLLLYNELLIKIGALENLNDKFERLSYYLNMIEKEKYSTIEYIDLRVSNKLLVKE